MGAFEMGIGEIILISAGLSADAFSAAVCRGLNMRKLDLKQGYVIALFFGGFQALMPIIGYLLGSAFYGGIAAFDHWIAFALLTFIGGKTVVEAIKNKDGDGETAVRANLGELTVTAVATSIDALAVGITFAFLSVRIVPAAAMIGTVTFALSLAGVLIGCRFGARFKNKAELAGGIILILIGVKILLEHLKIIDF